MYFKNNLLFLMNKNNLTQSQLAKIFGISRQSINQLINTQNPQATTIIKVSEYFNIPIDDLLKKDLSKEDNK